MLSWFIAWLQRFVQLGIDLAVQLIAGILRAPLTAAERSGPEPVFRRASAEEVIDLRHRVLREGRPREDAIFPGDDAPDTRHWVAVRKEAAGDRIVGVASVMRAEPPEPLPHAPRWQLRGMAVDPALRGLRIGERLLAMAEREIGEPMWCNARANVAGFYERSRWVVHGKPFDVPGIGPHVRMYCSGT